MVVTLRPKLTAGIVLIAMFATAGSTFAAAAHATCVTPQHQCDDVPTIAECCCNAPSGPGQSALPEQRVEGTAAAATAAPAIVDVAPLVRIQPTLDKANMFSPRLCLLDLPTLFAALLI